MKGNEPVNLFYFCQAINLTKVKKCVLRYLCFLLGHKIRREKSNLVKTSVNGESFRVVNVACDAGFIPLVTLVVLVESLGVFLAMNHVSHRVDASVFPGRRALFGAHHTLRFNRKYAISILLYPLYL